MGANTWGHHFQIHSFGESHGAALGCVIEGCPAGVIYDESLLLTELARRRPGWHGTVQDQVVSARTEQDQPEILSGVFEGRTLGTPIAVMIRNQDQRSQDYDSLRNNARAGHADDVWKNKFGHQDHRGGGRASGRETVARVIGGAFAQMLIRQLCPEMRIHGFATQVGPIVLSVEERKNWLEKVSLSKEKYPQDLYPARFPSEKSEKVHSLLEQARQQGESYGAQAEIHVFNMKANLGQPVFWKLKSDLAQALMSLGAVSAVELGFGETEVGTEFHQEAQSQVYGGIRGGISTGENLIFKIKMKPTSSILDVSKKGRHDPCIVTRAIPVLEAMTALVLADHLLLSRMDRV